MRVEHVPVYRKAEIVFPQDMLSHMPSHIALFTTTQYIDKIDAMEEQLKKAGKQVELYQPRHTAQAGQVLGCSIQTWPDVEAFLYVGEGEFHPKALAFKNHQPIYQYEPLLNNWFVMDTEDIKRILKQHKGAMLKFYHANVCGVLTTTKSGQKDMQAVAKLREKYPNKEFIHFLANTVDWQGLEDFPFVEVWINTGCPRIGLDDQNKIERPVINAEHALEGEHSF